MENKKKKLIAIVGTTASGKTGLAVKLCLDFDGEVISADSRQVYRGMDIGTGKDLVEYRVKRGNKYIDIPYHLIDVASPKRRFTLASYQKKSFQAIDDVLARGKNAFLVGGTGLYSQAVIDNYNLSFVKPDLKLRKELDSLEIVDILNKLKKASKLSKKEFKEITKEKNKRRLVRYLEFCLTTNKPLGDLFTKQDPKYDVLIIGLTFPKDILERRIRKRLKDRLEKEDMLGEIERLKGEGVSWKKLEEFGLEYRYLSLYLRGNISYEQMFEEIIKASLQFAKRQLTWFKRDKRTIWVKNNTEAKKKIKEFLK
jgi:tRNA dimethylallyltransferase